MLGFPQIGEFVWVWFHWHGSYSVATGKVVRLCENGTQAEVFFKRCPFMKGVGPGTAYPMLADYGKRPHWVPVKPNG